MNENINNLTAQVDGLIGSDGMTERITDLSARNVDAFATLTLTISNPPTQAQVQAVLDKLNELIAGLHH